MKRLILNADDFGLTDGVTAGIVEAIEQGIVTSTTAMVCVAGAAERLRQWGPRLPGRVGAHLQLTDGRPCLPASEVPSLAGADGLFPRSRRDVRAPAPEEVRREWEAQLARLRSFGIQPSHLDSHHHIHFEPAIFPVFLEVARAQGLPVRSSRRFTRQLRERGLACPDLGVTEWYQESLTAGHLLEIVDRAFASLRGEGTVELMCHPGHSDAELAKLSSYVADRDEELAALCSPEVKEGLASRGVELVSMSALSAATPQPETTVRQPG